MLLRIIKKNWLLILTLVLNQLQTRSCAEATSCTRTQFYIISPKLDAHWSLRHPAAAWLVDTLVSIWYLIIIYMVENIYFSMPHLLECFKELKNWYPKGKTFSKGFRAILVLTIIFFRKKRATLEAYIKNLIGNFHCMAYRPPKGSRMI